MKQNTPTEGKKPRRNETSRQRWKRRSVYYAHDKQRAKLKQERLLKRLGMRAIKQSEAQHDPTSFYDKVHCPS